MFPCCNVKVAPEIVAGSMGSLKVAVRFALFATPTLPFAGTVKLTLGGVLSTGFGIPTLPEKLALLSVTAALSAKALPSSVAPASIVTEVNASTVPFMTEVVPKVAEEPTCQKMLAALAPPLRTILRSEVMSKPDAIWKMNTPFGSPWASSVRSPDEIASVEVDL
ncbi:MAG: hypothetical protein COZ06_07315 [Armatimonadetes bacterium CG_4_10_14_3_um_filter_66_18]|nr:MAG: hypothetical protein COZ06_07315 [Armatimonadetes bacterium CG_4_10_14_3_um_filter_66_18]